jgi:hypothetical protein
MVVFLGQGTSFLFRKVIFRHMREGCPGVFASPHFPHVPAQWVLAAPWSAWRELRQCG